MNSAFRGLVLVIISAFGYSTEAIFIKLAYGAGLSTRSTLFYRFGIASLFLLPFFLTALRRHRPPRCIHLLLALIGIGLNTPVVAALAHSLHYLSASVAIIVLYLYPTMVAVLETRFLGRPLTRNRVVALVLSFAGITIVSLPGGYRVNPVGVFWALLAAVLNAASVVTIKRRLAKYPPLLTTSEVILFMSLTFFTAAAVGGGIQSVAAPEDILILTGLALVSTVIPFICFYSALKYLPASAVSIVSSSEPVMTIGLARIFLQESLFPAQIFGTALVLAAVCLVSAESRRHASGANYQQETGNL